MLRPKTIAGPGGKRPFLTARRKRGLCQEYGDGNVGGVPREEHRIGCLKVSMMFLTTIRTTRPRSSTLHPNL